MRHGGLRQNAEMKEGVQEDIAITAEGGDVVGLRSTVAWGDRQPTERDKESIRFQLGNAKTFGGPYPEATAERRLGAAKVLGDYPGPEVREALIALSADECWQVRRAAVISLRGALEYNVVPAMKAVLARLKDENEDPLVRRSAIRSLNLHGWAAHVAVEACQPELLVVDRSEGYPFPEDELTHWREIKAGVRQPDADTQAVLDATESALKSGLFYATDVFRFVVENLPKGFFTPRDMARQSNMLTTTENGMVGSEIYHARQVIEDRWARESARNAASQFSVGQALKNLPVNSRHTFSTATITEIRENGDVLLDCIKRGSKKRWTVTMPADALAERLPSKDALEQAAPAGQSVGLTKVQVEALNAVRLPEGWKAYPLDGGVGIERPGEDSPDYLTHSDFKISVTTTTTLPGWGRSVLDQIARAVWRLGIDSDWVEQKGRYAETPQNGASKD